MFAGLPLAPPDPIFGLSARCKQDPDTKKIDLVVGAYRDEDGKPYLLRVVKQAEEQLAQAGHNREYLPIDGFRPFCDASARLVLGDDSPSLAQGRVSTVQSLSGTGGLRLAGTLLAKVNSDRPVMVSTPTWGNHKAVFNTAGFANVQSFRYLDSTTNGVDFKGMMEDLSAAPDGAVVIVQMCAHNPTGADCTPDQWKELGALCKQKRFSIVMDAAYQGYATGDLVADAQAARLFDQLGLEFMICQSYAKNLGLYGERIGCITTVCESADAANIVSSQMKVLVRAMYSNPPTHGARVAHLILTDPDLRSAWETELKGMSCRILQMREALRKELERLDTPGDWSHLTKQIGMFSYTGLSKEQCERLTNEFHVYLLPSGRVSIPGLCAATVPYLAQCIHKVVTS